MKQLRKREAAERRAAAESQMDANLIPLGQRPVRASCRSYPCPLQGLSWLLAPSCPSSSEAPGQGVESMVTL